jgi:hypothetical protein
VNPSSQSFRLRAPFVVASAAGLVLMTAGPAAAHVEVSAEGAQAGAGPVTLSFMAESESPSLGVVGVKTHLPDGIAPADVSVAGGPEGWVLTPTADGFELGGPALAPGLDAEYSVTVAQLPADATELVFPTLQRYSDGREDAWIEPVTADLPNPERPAPVLSVAPAPPGATAPSAEASSPTATGTPTKVSTDASEHAAHEDSGNSVLGLVVAAAVLVIGAAVWIVRRRRA